MFSYYLKSLHSYREQHLDAGKATFLACLDVASSYVEVQYAFSQAILHQGMRPLTMSEPGLKKFWSVSFDDDTHQELLQNWIMVHLEKINHLHQLLVDSSALHAIGFNALIMELVGKLKHDLPVGCEAGLESIKEALLSKNALEESFVNTAKAGVSVMGLPNFAKRPVMPLQSGKQLVKRVAIKGKTT